MQSTRSFLFASIACLLLLGCQTAADSASKPTTLSAAPGVAVTQSNNAPTTDDAALVLAQCNHPSSDRVLPLYNKMNNGPIRRMIYHGKRTITIEFIPSHPITRGALDPASPNHRPRRLTAKLPPNSVWRFDEASIPHEEDVITAQRLAYFLPCAAKALHAEY